LQLYRDWKIDNQNQELKMEDFENHLKEQEGTKEKKVHSLMEVIQLIKDWIPEDKPGDYFHLSFSLFLASIGLTYSLPTIQDQNIMNIVWEFFFYLQETGVIRSDELTLLTAWFEDLLLLGYLPPPTIDLEERVLLLDR
jgi:hypothetical protein